MAILPMPINSGRRSPPRSSGVKPLILRTGGVRSRSSLPGSLFQLLWQYEKTPKRKGGRVYIDVNGKGEVVFHEGYLTAKEARKREDDDTCKWRTRATRASAARSHFRHDQLYRPAPSCGSAVGAGDPALAGAACHGRPCHLRLATVAGGGAESAGRAIRRSMKASKPALPRRVSTSSAVRSWRCWAEQPKVPAMRSIVGMAAEGLILNRRR